MQPSRFLDNRCEIAELAFAYALQVLPTSEVAAAEAHIASCPDCQRELQSLGPVVDRLVAWPTDVLRPTTSPRARPALPIAEETGNQPVLPPRRQGEQAWTEPEWEQVAIECKLLATDTERHRVSMLVRLAPAASYPATHMRKWKSCISSTVKLQLQSARSGRRARLEPTGCTCLLVTSTKAILHFQEGTTRDRSQTDKS